MGVPTCCKVEAHLEFLTVGLELAPPKGIARRRSIEIREKG